MAISLRGAAATVLINLPPEQHQDYGTLTAALDSRFGLAHQTELNRMKVMTSRMEEILRELTEDVECLVHLAYPVAGEAMVEVLHRTSLSMHSLKKIRDCAFTITNRQPKDGLRTALELESYQLTSKHKVCCVREADYPVQRQAPMAVAGDVLQQLLKAIQNLARSHRKSGETSAPDRREAKMAVGIPCFAGSATMELLDW